MNTRPLPVRRTERLRKERLALRAQQRKNLTEKARALTRTQCVSLPEDSRAGEVVVLSHQADVDESSLIGSLVAPGVRMSHAERAISALPPSHHGRPKLYTWHVVTDSPLGETMLPGTRFALHNIVTSSFLAPSQKPRAQPGAGDEMVFGWATHPHPVYFTYHGPAQACTTDVKVENPSGGDTESATPLYAHRPPVASQSPDRCAGLEFVPETYGAPWENASLKTAAGSGIVWQCRVVPATETSTASHPDNLQDPVCVLVNRPPVAASAADGGVGEGRVLSTLAECATGTGVVFIDPASKSAFVPEHMSVQVARAGTGPVAAVLVLQSEAGTQRSGHVQTLRVENRALQNDVRPPESTKCYTLLSATATEIMDMMSGPIQQYASERSAQRETQV